LEASAAEAKSCTSRLVAFLNSMEATVSVDSLNDFMRSRRKDKEITQEITQELCRTFVTPLEREDIEELSNSLYKIPKTVLKISERLLLCPVDLREDESLRRQIILLEQAGEVIFQMVKQLRHGGNVVDIRERNSHLQQIEGEADKLVMGMLGALYRGEREAKDVIILKDVYELLERAIDRCRDAGNTVFQIVLKNS
jgi:uncharacterized protein Yka (UPF0111/DUF47 family)